MLVSIIFVIVWIALVCMIVEVGLMIYCYHFFPLFLSTAAAALALKPGSFPVAILAAAAEVIFVIFTSCIAD